MPWNLTKISLEEKALLMETKFNVKNVKTKLPFNCNLHLFTKLIANFLSKIVKNYQMLSNKTSIKYFISKTKLLNSSTTTTTG